MSGCRLSSAVPLLLSEVSMRRLMQTVALVLAGAGVSACAPHPIVARDPVPPPSPAEAYDCGSMRLPLNAVATECAPRYREAPVVLRSRG